MTRAWAAGYVLLAVGAGWALLDRSSLGVLLACAGACSVCGWRLVRSGASARLILGVALAARLCAFAAPPSLSDDGYRYLWDGYVQHAGVSPYAERPAAAPHLGPPEVLDRMNSDAFYSVYPPLTQAVFAAATVWSDDWRVAWYAWKLACLIAEGAGGLLLVRLVGASASALYLLHPLSWIEAVGQAHSEALLVPLLLGAAYALRAPALHAWAGVAVALGALVKLYPVVLLPLFARSRAAWGAAAAVALAVASPYLSVEALRNGLESVRLFGVYFEFGAAPFMLVKAALWEHAPSLGPHAGRILTATFLLLLPLVLMGYRRRPVRGAFAVVALYLALSATLHPWYVVPLLALAPLLRPVPLWLPAFGLLSLLTYSRYVWGEEAYLASVGLAWGGALAIALVTQTMRRLAPDAPARAQGRPAEGRHRETPS